jgi:hypothetical protein
MSGGMISRRFTAWQKVVALAPLLLLAVYLPGQMMLRCRFDGLLRAACCCPRQREAQDTGPVIKAQDCCEQQVTASQRPVVVPARLSGGDRDMASAVSLAVPVVSVGPSLVAPDRSGRFGRAHGRPWDGPPIVLLKHAFLI